MLARQALPVLVIALTPVIGNAQGAQAAHGDTVPVNRDAPARSPLWAMAGRMAGVHVTSLSGNPGADPAVELRPTSSVFVSPDPLVVVDGAITRMTLADLNADDVERIEVLKGPSASAMYGVDGGNGVVLVFTKRAQTSGSQAIVTSRNEFGQNMITRRLHIAAHHPFQLNNAGTDFAYDALGSRILDNDQIADNPYPVYHDFQSALFRSRAFISNYVTASQRFDRGGYFASFDNDRDGGGVALVRSFSRRNGRINVDLAPLRGLELRAGGFVGRSSYPSDTDNLFAAARFIEPLANLDSTVSSPCPTGQTSCYVPRIGLEPVQVRLNPLYLASEVRDDEDDDRRTGHVGLRYRPMSWLTVDAQLASDRANGAAQYVSPAGLAGGGPSGGYAYQRKTEARVNHQSLAVSVSHLLYHERVQADATVGYANEDSRAHSLQWSAATLGPPSSLSSSWFRSRSTTGTFASAGARMGRFAVDGGIRHDESDAFGPLVHLPLYHHVAASYRIDSLAHAGFVGDVLLRVSHGTAGINGPDEELFVLGLPSPNAPPPLEPALATETEYRLGMRLFGRYSAEYNYVQRTTEKLLVSVPLPVATGYAHLWKNAGTVAGNIHELTLGSEYHVASDALLRLDVTADRSRSRIVDLSSPPFLTQSGRVRAGESLGSIYGLTFIQTPEQLDETIRAGRLTGSASDYVRNEEGYYVAAARWHTVNEVPLIAYQCPTSGASCADATSLQRIGTTNPDFTAGFMPSLSWKSLRGSATVTWVQGGNIVNLSRLYSFYEYTDPAYDQSAKGTTTCPDITVDATCPYASGKKPRSYYGTFYSGSQLSSYFVENGSYVRVRDLALAWRLPIKWSRPFRATSGAEIGVIGRNLFTKSSYSGLDPEAAIRNADTGVTTRQDFYQYPTYRTVTLSVRLAL
jgi:TonB-dependent SusC/RagA subfamily outer membrane receptor